MIIFIAMYLLLSTLGMVFIKLGSENLNLILTKENFGFQVSWITVLGIIFYLTSFLLWIGILSKYNLSFISPIVSGIAYILIIFFSRFFLGENINSYQWIGIIIILVGVTLMNIKK